MAAPLSHPISSLDDNKVDPQEQGIRLPDERAPLISRIDSHSSLERPASLPLEFHLSKATVYCLLLSFLIELSNIILTVPLISLFERSICETYYREHSLLLTQVPVDEALCKVSPVQSELAKLRGWKAFFETLSGTIQYIQTFHPSASSSNCCQQWWWQFLLANWRTTSIIARCLPSFCLACSWPFYRQS